MKKIILTLIALSIMALPVAALAQVGGNPPTINISLTELGNRIANAAWIVFTIIAVIMFIVAGILFLTAQGNPEKVSAARMAFLWGVVGIVVGILAFTIITVVRSIF